MVWEQTHVGTRNGVVVLYSSHKMIVIVVIVAIAVVKVTVAAPAVVTHCIDPGCCCRHQAPPHSGMDSLGNPVVAV